MGFDEGTRDDHGECRHDIATLQAEITALREQLAASKAKASRNWSLANRLNRAKADAARLEESLDVAWGRVRDNEARITQLKTQLATAVKRAEAAEKEVTTTNHAAALVEDMRVREVKRAEAAEAILKNLNLPRIGRLDGEGDARKIVVDSILVPCQEVWLIDEHNESYRFWATIWHHDGAGIVIYSDHVMDYRGPDELFDSQAAAEFAIEKARTA